MKKKKCKNCGEDFSPRFRTTERYCSGSCFFKNQEATPVKKKRKRIPAFSTKRKGEMPIYKKLRKEFLNKQENKICFIEGCTAIANTIEHTRGREGYADESARERGITLYIDDRYFKPCCLHHNLQLERDPELSKKYQLSKIHGGKKL